MYIMIEKIVQEILAQSEILHIDRDLLEDFLDEYEEMFLVDVEDFLSTQGSQDIIIMANGGMFDWYYNFRFDCCTDHAWEIDSLTAFLDDIFEELV